VADVVLTKKEEKNMLKLNTIVSAEQHAIGNKVRMRSVKGRQQEELITSLF
jgi:hypothetical protein